MLSLWIRLSKICSHILLPLVWECMLFLFFEAATELGSRKWDLKLSCYSWLNVSIIDTNWKWVKLLSPVGLFGTPWTVAHQAPPSTEFSRQEYWSGLPFPSPGDLPDPGIEPRSPALQADSLPSEPPGKSINDTSFWLISRILTKWILTNFIVSFCLLLWRGKLLDVLILPFLLASPPSSF